MWIKPNKAPFYGHAFATDKEYLLIFWRNGALRRTAYDTCRGWWVENVNSADKALYGHPTIKPLGITSKILRVFTDPGDMVLDPFSGSGTTAVACKELGRSFLGFEIDPKWHKVACDRLAGQTQKEAEAKIAQMKLF